MATGDQFADLRPAQLSRENGPSQYTPRLLAGPPGPAGATTPVAAVAIEGVPLHKLNGDGYQFTFRVPTNGAPLGTGLTFGVYLCDDPNNPSPGNVVQLGITVKRITLSAADLSLTGAAAEQTFGATLPATVGQVVRQDCAIANANLGGLAAGDLALVRVRRQGTLAADTHAGVALLIGASVRDT